MELFRIGFILIFILVPCPAVFRCIGSQPECPVYCTTRVMVVEAWDVPLVPVIVTV
jgi:hypothetical protein